MCDAGTPAAYVYYFYYYVNILCSASDVRSDRIGANPRRRRAVVGIVIRVGGLSQQCDDGDDGNGRRKLITLKYAQLRACVPTLNRPPVECTHTHTCTRRRAPISMLCIQNEKMPNDNRYKTTTASQTRRDDPPTTLFTHHHRHVCAQRLNCSHEVRPHCPRLCAQASAQHI